MATLKFCLGIVLGVVTFCGLLLNIIVVRPVYQMAFREQRSPIYVISFVNIVNDAISLSSTLCFLVPTIIADSWIFAEKEHSVVTQIFGGIFLFTWYSGSLTQILMATNRLVVICFRSNSFFTKKNIVRLVIAFLPIIAFMVWLAQFGLPCCQFTFSHETLSFDYVRIENITNYSNKFIDVCLNSCTSIISSVSYSIIIIHVHSSSKTVTSILSDEERRNRRKKEYSYAMQFCLISLFYTFAWLTFRVFPYIVAYVGAEWFVGTALFVTLNSSSNAFVYLITNKEASLRHRQSWVRRHLKGTWLGTAANAARSIAERSQGRSTSEQQSSGIQPNAQSTTSQAAEVKNT